MIYPSQEREIKDFLDELLKYYNRALVKGDDIPVDCPTVEKLMERAKDLRSRLAVWTIIPEEEPERVRS